MKNIHLIPTDKPSRLFIIEGKLFNYHKPQEGDGVKIINQNIYITSDEEIKKGDWYLNIKKGDWYLNTEEKNGSMNPFYGKLYKANQSINHVSSNYIHNLKKIILTTDQDLIKDGVQAIDDEFLEWFVKNPSCEFVEVNDWMSTNGTIAFGGDKRYQLCNHLNTKPIIPKEESKYPIGGYAPGYYSGKCITCKTEFMGDKRAVRCEPCAIEITKIKITSNNTGGNEIKQETTLEEAVENYFRNEPNATLKLIIKYSFKDGAKWQQERMYSEEEVLKAIDMSRVFYKTTEDDGYDEFKYTPIEIIEQFKK